MAFLFTAMLKVAERFNVLRIDISVLKRTEISIRYVVFPWDERMCYSSFLSLVVRLHISGAISYTYQ